MENNTGRIRENKARIIADTLGKEEILLQLAEECSELAQACVKYHRALHRLTPMSEDAAVESLAEELADVSLIIEQVKYLFGPDFTGKTYATWGRKIKRWYQRLFKKEDL